MERANCTGNFVASRNYHNEKTLGLLRDNYVVLQERYIYARDTNVNK